MEECPPYEAMSYTWGDDEASESILVNDVGFDLRPNLFSALVSLRKIDTPRTIWVDAICINQLDESERSHQVWQMNKIYSRAEVVNVWLGNATPSTDAGINFLEHFYSVLYHNRHGQLPVLGSTIQLFESGASRYKDRHTSFVYPRCIESYYEFYGPLLSQLDDPAMVTNLNHSVALLAKSWWRRMWTLQESVLCSEVRCWCGSRTFPIERLYHLSDFIYFSVNFSLWKGAPIQPEVSLRTVLRAAALRKHLATRARIRLVLALDSTWNRAASDKKDKIIGLLGLVGDYHGLEPEYSWPVEKVYRVAMRAALIEEKSLDCLGLISESRALRVNGLNSWVPDFSVHDAPFSDNLTSLSKPIFGRNIFNASLYRPEFEPHISTEDDDSILVVEGLHVDDIKRVGLKAPGPHLVSDTDSSSVSWKDSMRRVLKEWRSMVSHQETYLTKEPFSLAFWKTVLADLKQAQHPQTMSAIGARRLDENDIPWLSQLDSPEGIENLLNAWGACVGPEYQHLRLLEQFNRRFILTTTGYIGLGPPDVQEGDSISVLMGGTVAYALRKNPDSTWCYIGECYIHGIMDGEMILHALEHKVEFTKFKIT